MSTRIFYPYAEPSLNELKMRSGVPPWAWGPYDQKLVNAIVSNYAQTRRMQLCMPHNTQGVHTFSSEYQLQRWMPWFRIPLGRRIIRMGQAKKLRFDLYCKTDSEASGHNVDVRAQLDNGDGDEVTVLTTSWGYKTIEIDLTKVQESNEWLSLMLRAQSGNVFSCKSISGFQEQTSATPAWISLNATNQVIGDDDYPDSVMLMRLIRNATVAVREQKTVRSNVLTHWFYPSYKQGSDYSGTYDDLGRYRFAKRAGMSEVKVHCLACKSVGDPDWTLRVDLEGVTVAAQEDTVDQTTPTWYTFTFTLTGSDITDEVISEVLFDGKEGTAATYQHLPYFIVLESPGSSLVHVVPDVVEVPAGSSIISDQFDAMRTTLHHLFTRGGAAICCADYRVGTDAGDYLYCNATSPGKANIGGSSTSTVARGIVFPSTSSKRIRLSMGYETNSGSSYTKHINMQISDDLDFDTWDDTDPRYEDFTHGAYQFTEEKDTEDVISCDLDIPSGDWETHEPGGGQPLQFWISAWTDNSGEYVVPKWVAVQEVELDQEEFP